MEILEFLLALGVAYALAWALYVVLIPLWSAISRTDRPGPTRHGVETPRIAVIVPARDMSAVIARCLNSIFASGYPRDALTVYTVADHCSDDTARIATEAGASVLHRQEGPAGKTYTLAWAFEQLGGLEKKPDLYVVTDATARVAPGFFDALVEKWRQGEDIIVSHPLVDAANQKWFARCLGLTLVHRNLQNRARQRLGLSALIEGRGMAYSRQYISRHGWSLALPKGAFTGSHPTEDWRHGVRAVENGYRVAFADEARVVTPLRDTLAAATQQGARWERGRMANAATHALRLLLTGLRQKDRIKLFAALDGIQLPVVILGAVSFVLAVLCLTVNPNNGISVAFGLAPATLLGIYGLAVAAQGRQDGIEATALLWAPVYVAWRCLSFILAWGFLDRLKLSGKKSSSTG